MEMRIRIGGWAAGLLLAGLAACGGSSSGPAPASSSSGGGTVASLSGVCGAAIAPGTGATIPNSGRTVFPLGRMTEVGNFPTGGALTSDGRYYWSLSAGHGLNDIRIVEVASGKVLQVIPMPGTYGQMAFSADGTAAYVSGEPQGGMTPAGPTVGDKGDVIHVFAVDPMTGAATEGTPISLPMVEGGSARLSGLPPNPNLPDFPAGIAVSADGKTLVVAYYNADQAAVIDVAHGSVSTIKVGHYPFAAAIERNGRYAYISNSLDGTLSRIDLGKSLQTQLPVTIAGLGGPKGDYIALPQYILADPKQDRLFVADTNHDGVAIVDTATDKVQQFISLLRPDGYGAAPTALALSPDESTLYVSTAGENAVVSIALTDRPAGGPKAYSVIGKIPTADYPQDVRVTADGCTLVWTAARGLGTLPNVAYQMDIFNSLPTPYGQYVPDMLTGQVGVVPTPDDAAFATLAPTVERSVIPGDGSGTVAAAPAGTPLVGPGGGASDKIKYVFYVVKENRTYDQIFGADPRGNGDPALQLFDDNGTSTPGHGTTPNAHALSRMFVLLDNFYEDSEVSVDGHAITTGAYASNYTVKTMHGDYSGRGRPSSDEGVFPISFPPNDFLFDAAVRQKISFHNYGERSGGALIPSKDRTDTFAAVEANTDPVYAINLFNGCEPSNAPGVPNTPLCAFDSGLGAAPPLAQSRIDAFKKTFDAQLAAGSVSHFNYMIMMSDHTNGTGKGTRNPLSMVADNDLGVGQLVQLVSSSPIWPESVIFVVEDDSQDGADHVDAHRAPALVIGPYVKHGGQVVHTHYDQLSVIRTIELILGMQPLSLYDADAVPMYDVFAATPDTRNYNAVVPEVSLMLVNKGGPLSAELSARLPFDKLDAVPQELSDYVLYKAVYGEGFAPPRAGPHASRQEHRRAVEAWRALVRGGDVRGMLVRSVRDADD